MLSVDEGNDVFGGGDAEKGFFLVAARERGRDRGHVRGGWFSRVREEVEWNQLFILFLGGGQNNKIKHTKAKIKIIITLHNI